MCDAVNTFNRLDPPPQLVPAPATWSTTDAPPSTWRLAELVAPLDRMALDAGPAEDLAALVRQRPQVEPIVAGHLPRSISRPWAGTVAATVPSVAHAVMLDVRPCGVAAWNLEPPAMAMNLWQQKLGVVAHQLAIGEFWAGRFGDD